MKIMLGFDDEEINARWKKNRPIITSIAVKVNKIYFPSEDWNDFSTVILTWWLNNVIDHSKGSTTSRNDFMDGPFSFEIRKKDDLVNIAFYEKEALVAESSISFKEYSKTVINAAHELLEKLQSMGIEDDDLKELRNTYDRANRTLNT